MKEVFLWTIKYMYEGTFGVNEQEIRIITSDDSYGTAEEVAIFTITEWLESNRKEAKFIRICNISPSEIIYSME